MKQKLNCLEQTISNFKEEDEDSFVTLALLKTAMHLCKVLASDNAVQFSDIYSCFLSFLPNSLNCDIRWSKSRVLTFIGNEFGDLSSSVCQNKRDGGIFFRSKSNLFDLLSHALNKSPFHTGTCPSEDLIASVIKLVHHLAQSRHDPAVLTDLDVDKFINTTCSIAPDLWEHIFTLTQTVNERKGHTASISQDRFAGCIKRLYRAYLLSVIPCAAC